MLRTLLALLLIGVLGTFVLSLPVVQTKLAQYVTKRVNREFNTDMNIEKLRVSLISWDTDLEDVLIKDYEKDTLFYINKLTTSIVSIGNLVNGKLEFGAIDVNQLDFKLTTYKDSTISNLEVFIDKLDDGKPRDKDTPPFYMASSHINIDSSAFVMTNENLQHKKILDFSDLNIDASDFQILGPEVSLGINDMSFNSGRGIRVDSMKTNFKYTKEQMRFDSLNIKTSGSLLNGNLVFNYDRKDFRDFFNLVQVDAHFVDSRVAFDEINMVYDQFGKGKEVSFSSNLSGVLNDLTTEDLFLLSDNTGIRGDFNFKNLFDRNQGFIMDAKMKNVTSSYYQLRALMPNILGKSLPPSIFKKLGQFTIRGDALVTETSITAKVNLNTAIGSSYADLTLTDINTIDNATYKGFVSLIDFDLGNFANNQRLGKATLDFNVEGRSFLTEQLNTEVIGEVYSLVFNGYEYNNLKVSGLVKEQLFDGSVTSNDTNLKFDFKGLADFGAERNNFNFIASVAYADLKKLNFINDSISIFRGNVNMDATGNTLDNLEGEIKFTKTIFQNKNDTYYFDDFEIVSAFESDSIRTININSPDIITGYLRGNFKVNELGKLVQNSLGSIYTNYRPFEISGGQNLAFNFKIYNKIVDVFFPEVKFDPNTFIKGNIKADEGDFKLTFKSPSIEAFGSEADEIDVTIDNKNPLFNTFAQIGNFKNPYYDVKNFNIINTKLKDTLFFRAEFAGGSAYNDIYNLNFYHTFNKENKSVIGLKKSDIDLKGNKWILNKDNNSQNKVIVNRTLDSINIQEIVMNNSKEEQIKLRGSLADSTSKDLQLEFKIVSLDKITPAIDSLKLEGEVNGILNVFQKDGIYLPSSNLKIANFKINKMAVGDVAVGIVGNKDLTEFSVNTQITDNGVEKIGVFGKINNSGEIPIADLLVNLSDFDITPFSPLGEGVLDNIRGYVSGSATIKGEVNNPQFGGILTLDRAGIGIPYLNVNYSFAPSSRVNLFDQTFDFDRIAVTDVSENTRATLDGTISHSFFTDWRLDLNVDTRGDRLLILNTELAEESLYYGTGFLNGKGRIYGSTKALNIDVEGETARGTSLKIPLSDVVSVGDYSFINFISKKDIDSLRTTRVLDEVQGLQLEFELDITKDAEVQIVTDVTTGSTLKGTGEGPMLIRINTRGDFEMFGEFNVVTGEFDYKFGNIINKKFTVKPGGSLSWNGPPLGATLNMEAVYGLNANPAPLLDNAGYSRKIATNVVIKLTEELEKPKIDFEIEFPGTNSIIQSELEYRLRDPTVQERNALFLLAQGSFVNDQTGFNAGAATGTIAAQSFSNILNQVLSSGDEKLKFGISLEPGQTYADAQTENRFGVTLSTKISDRVLFNGQVGVPVGGASETVVAGNFEMQVLLNEEGTLSAKFFSRESEIQAFLAERLGSTQGLGLSYEVDFDTFRELTRKILQKKDKPVEPIENPVGAPEDPPVSVMGNDSLIRVYPKPRPNGF